MRKLLQWLLRQPPDYCCECAYYMPDETYLGWAEEAGISTAKKESCKENAMKFAHCGAVPERRFRGGEAFLCYPKKPQGFFDYCYCSIVRELHQGVVKWCKHYEERVKEK